MLIISTRLFCFWEKDGRVLVSLLNLNMSLKLDIHVLTSLKRCRSIVDTHFWNSQLNCGCPSFASFVHLRNSLLSCGCPTILHNFQLSLSWVSGFNYMVLITTVVPTLSTFIRLVKGGCPSFNLNQNYGCLSFGFVIRRGSGTGCAYG